MLPGEEAPEPWRSFFGDVDRLLDEEVELPAKSSGREGRNDLTLKLWLEAYWP